MNFDEWSIEVKSESPCAFIDRYRGILDNMSRSVFQSYEWLGPWCKIMSAETKVCALVLYRKNEISGLVVFGEQHRRRLGFIPIRGIRLLEIGEKERDIFAIEHNGVICPERSVQFGTEYFLQTILDSKSNVDEVWMPGIGALDFRAVQRAVEIQGNDYRVYDEKPFYSVNIELLGNQPDSFLASLSANTRYQIRRAKRHLQSIGEIETRCASSVPEALAFLERLVEFHEMYWRQKNEESAFVTKFAQHFHHDLICSAMAAGMVQILRVRAGETDIGYLYNLLHKDTVYCYQSGFNYDLGKFSKPGLVCHAEAVEYNRRLGIRKYDFLAGDSQYKRSLSNETDRMYWIVVQKRSLSQKIEAIARSFKRGLL